MKKAAVVSNDISLSAVYQTFQFAKDFVWKYVKGDKGVREINNGSQIEESISKLVRAPIAEWQAKQFTEAYTARDESGRNFMFLGDPKTGDKVLTLRNTENTLLAKYSTSKKLISYYKPKATA